MAIPLRELQPGDRLIVTNDPEGWFAPRSTVIVVADCRQGGVLVEGERADGSHDQELCVWEEFEPPLED